MIDIDMKLFEYQSQLDSAALTASNFPGLIKNRKNLIRKWVSAY